MGALCLECMGAPMKDMSVDPIEKNEAEEKGRSGEGAASIIPHLPDADGQDKPPSTAVAEEVPPPVREGRRHGNEHQQLHSG